MLPRAIGREISNGGIVSTDCSKGKVKSKDRLQAFTDGPNVLSSDKGNEEAMPEVKNLLAQCKC